MIQPKTKLEYVYGVVRESSIQAEQESELFRWFISLFVFFSTKKPWTHALLVDRISKLYF